MKHLLAATAFLLAPLSGLTGQQQTSAHMPEHRLAASMQHKLDRIHENSERSRPDQTPTVMTEEEINDYFAAGYVKLPVGVKKVTFLGKSGAITAFLTVDFDEIRAGQRSSNPLLSIFSGTHNVRAEGDATASGGVGKVHVRTISIDGTEIPRMALEFFATKFLTPKYPNVGLDSEFKLTDRIDAAVVGYHKLTAVQK